MKGSVRPLAVLVSALLLAFPARAQDAKPVLVFAAASLTESFSALGEAFMKAHAPARVEQNFAGSRSLVAQIEWGAPADVIATADRTSMARLEAAGLLAGESSVFARSRLEIVVENGNPKGIAGLADLARADLVVILAAEGVPAGRYAREALAAAGVAVEPKSLEENVKAVLNKVALGEADAGIVYTTDVCSAGGRVSGVAIPDAQNVIASYPIALVEHPTVREDAKSFVAFVLSAEGRAVLARLGFLAP